MERERDAAATDRRSTPAVSRSLAAARRWARAGGTLVAAGVLALAASPGASGAQPASSYRVQRLCGTPRAGAAACTGMKLLPSSLTPAQLHANAVRQASEAHPAVSQEAPTPGFLTPQSLHAAYALPTEQISGSAQTVAVVDAYDDPTAEADLGVYDAEFGLPACTSANGCFRKLDEQGKASPLPPTEGSWAGETSIDVQMVHAICQICHVLLVEAESEGFSDLGAAVDTAVAAGATEISNSYAGPEEPSYGEFGAAYDHPGVVIAAASGDCGYLNVACGWKEAANFPADFPDVVAVGGTRLTSSKGAWKSTVWSDGGSGCSLVFAAASWQQDLREFPATGCASGRAVADVAAIGDPNTGVDIYDSTPEGSGGPTGWGVWGGTSVASPIIAAEFALAGGAHGVAYPAATLYSHNGEGGAVYDVLSGANGSCAGASSCQAALGYDGPTGVGSPIGLRAFASAGAPVSIASPTVAGVAEQGLTLSATAASWSGSPTSISRQWEDCKSSCSAIAGASGSTYTLSPSDVGSTIRFREVALNSAGLSAPSASAATATVLSNTPTVTGFTPVAAPTGSWVTIDGTALENTGEVRFGNLAASAVRALSPTQLEALVPNGAIAGKIAVSTPVATAKSVAKFTPTLSLTGFSPSSGTPGTIVKVKGVGFNSATTVSFNGAPASIVHESASKLTVVAPNASGTGAITVTNTAAPLGAASSAASFTLK